MTKPFTPLEFQLADQKTLADNNYRALLAIEPGGMKTAAALMAHKNSGSSVTLVVAPEATHGTAWRPQAEWILGEEVRVVGNSGRKAVKEAMTDFKLGYPGIYAITPQLLTRMDTSDLMMDLLVVDEGHQLNNPGSKGQKAMQSLADKTDGRLFLSGTAWRNNFERAWSVMRLLWPELYRRGEVAYDNRFLWMRDRMMSEEVLIPPRKWYPTTWEKYRSLPEGYWRKNINGVPHIGEPGTAKKWLNEEEPGRLLSEAPCVIIHKKREECCEFHTVEKQGYAGFLNLEEPQIIEHTVELTSKQKKAIDDLEKTYVAFLEENPLVVELPITMQQRIRQICLGEPTVEDYTVLSKDGEELAKQKLRFEDDCKSPFYEQVLNILQEDEDENVIIYLESQTFAEVLTRRLNKDGIPAFEFSGKTKNTRDADLKEFGKKYRVLVGILSSVGTGVDSLQNVSKTEIWVESSVDNVNNEQAFSRLDRKGGIGQTQRHYILDSEGYAAGRLGTQLAQRIALNKTLRVKTDK